MKQCAFCPETAKLSAEHLWSDWVNDLFPGKKRFGRRNDEGEVVQRWITRSLDWKAKVVCKPCNETWMSTIESQHAKPAMADLIVGKTGIPISQSRANSIALFAFKTAVIFDHVSRSREPFFSDAARHGFRETLTIPDNVRMWMAGFGPRGRGEVMTMYHEGRTPLGDAFQFYVCTYGVGHLVFQVVACKNLMARSFWPSASFESLAVPFWTHIPEGFVWPAANVLRSSGQFNSFSRQWNDIVVQW
jgi:hypothetical protein